MTCPPAPRHLAGLALALLAAGAAAAPPDPPPACPGGGDGFRSPGAVAHFLEARLAGLRGDHLLEAEELRLAVAFDEGSAELRAAWAEALAAVGRIDAAEAEARRALACDGTGRSAAAAHLLLGRILAARRQVGPAQAELRDAMAIETARAAGGERADPEAWRLSASLQLEEGDDDAAAATLEAGVTAVGSDGGGFLELGQILLERRELARAEPWLRRAVQARPGEPELRYALGAALAGTGQPEEAEAQMRALLALDPDHAEALNFIGYGYVERGVRLEEAEAMLRRALRVAPRSGHIVDSLGWLLLKKGEVARAVEQLELAALLSGPDPEVLEHLGDAYRAAGRTGDAAAAWRRALGSFGDEPPAALLRLRASLERKLSGVAAPGPGPAAR